MIRLLFILGFRIRFLMGNAREVSRDLRYYIEAAEANSPLLQDYRDQMEIQQLECQRLKAAYTRSRLELSGEFLFVPIISKDGG